MDRRNGVHPAVIVQTPFGELGVFMASNKPEHGLSLGVCKINKNGTLHAPARRYDGCRFYSVNELCQWNS